MIAKRDSENGLPQTENGITERETGNGIPIPMIACLASVFLYKFTTSVRPSVTELGCASPADRARPGTPGLAHGLVA
jgi:hypothetical protein